MEDLLVTVGVIVLLNWLSVSMEAFSTATISHEIKDVDSDVIAEYKNPLFIREFIIFFKIPFCKIAVKCSPSSCFSTQAISGFLNKERKVC